MEQMIQEMFSLQLIEDKKVHEAHNTSYKKLLDENRYYYALFDELGELTHELKPDWCWWKNTVKEKDKVKVLEEFSDVTHFILSFVLARTNYVPFNRLEDEPRGQSEKEKPSVEGDPSLEESLFPFSSQPSYPSIEDRQGQAVPSSSIRPDDVIPTISFRQDDLHRVYAQNDRFLIGQQIQEILEYVLYANDPFTETSIQNDEGLILAWLALCSMLGLDFESEVYRPYVKKNAINQQRVANGY